MNPGDRIREAGTGRLGFVLHMSNMNEDQALVRYDGHDYNTPVIGLSRFEVLPSEPFRPNPPLPPVVTVKYHVVSWPFDVPGHYRTTELHHSPSRWMPVDGAIVDEITVR